MMRELVLGVASADDVAAVTRRSAIPSASTAAEAAAIVESVRLGGDAALHEASRRFGGGRLPTLVRRDELVSAAASADRDLMTAIESAIANVRAVHERQLPRDDVVEVVDGVQVARVWRPLRRVGVYVPGGTAPLPSTLIMTAVPALVAGVDEIVVATPTRGPEGVDSTVLATAEALGVGEIHAMGGAQAIAALAHGTETIAPVDKIVGPGNAWVTAAKLAVSGLCAIDMPAGPSEALVVADDGAHPRFVAADLLAQAEHGPDSPVVLVTVGRAVADEVRQAIDELLPRLSRRLMVERALADHGAVVVAPDRDQALAFADMWAPEHLSLHVEDPSAAADRIRSAGSIFVGPWSAEPVGDYASGANHVLPTGGLARSTGPLGTEDFGSWTQVQTLTRAGLAGLRPTVAALSTAEGLDAHHLAVEVRFEETT